MSQMIYLKRLIGFWCMPLMLALAADMAPAQQFTGDNQWTAPHGVGTFIATAGEEYSAVIGVAALIEDWEFNIGATHYPGDSFGLTDSHTTGTFYVKHRLRENEEQNGGLAFMAGTGIDPAHLQAGEVVDTFRSWWGNFNYTLPFRDGQIVWDLLPGIIVNVDKDQTGKTALGFTYASRVAIYDVVPQFAVVAEVFGTAGEAYAEPSYRLGLRWEREKLIVAGTYADAFDGSGGAGFEIGFMYLTEPRFCFGGC